MRVIETKDERERDSERSRESDGARERKRDREKGLQEEREGERHFLVFILRPLSSEYFLAHIPAWSRR